MTNADKFKQIFGLYATELWSKTEGEFLVWLNCDFNHSDITDKNVGDTISRQAANTGVEEYRQLAEWLKDYKRLKEQESCENAQPKQTADNCLDFDFDKVKEILKKDGLDNLIIDHSCEEKQEQTRDEKLIDDIDFAIKATNSQDDYDMGMRNGMRYVKSLIDGKEPRYELRRTDEEIKLGLNLGDEVVGDFGAKGIVVGIDTYRGDAVLSLLMRNHKVPQLVEASRYKTKTGRHFPQIIEVLEQIKGESDGEGECSYKRK